MPQHSYAVGDSVQVRWDGALYPATVVCLGPGWVQVALTVKGKQHRANRLPDELKPLHAEPAA